jgi:hypothetical protein
MSKTAKQYIALADSEKDEEQAEAELVEIASNIQSMEELALVSQVLKADCFRGPLLKALARTWLPKGQLKRDGSRVEVVLGGETRQIELPGITTLAQFQANTKASRPPLSIRVLDGQGYEVAKFVW